MRIKVRPSDKEFSLYLRKKRGYKCEFDGEFFPEGKGLTVSHFHGRRKESVRFDEENCDILCFRHHQFFEENPFEYVSWKKERMKSTDFLLLTIRANEYKKRDDKMDLIMVRALAKELA